MRREGKGHGIICEGGFDALDASAMSMCLALASSSVVFGGELQLVDDCSGEEKTKDEH